MKNKTQLEKRLVDIEMNIKRLSGPELREAIKEKSLITSSLRLLRITCDGRFLEVNLTILQNQLHKCETLLQNVDNEPGSIKQKTERIAKIKREYGMDSLINNIQIIEFILEKIERPG